MLNRRLIALFIGISTPMLILQSCYQKKGGQNTRVQMDQEMEVEDDTLIHSFDPDSIAYNDTFKLVSTETIFKHIRGNSKKKQAYQLPKINESDSLKDQIEHLAISNVYSAIATITNNKKLLNSTLKLSETLFNKITEDSIEYPAMQTLDSIKTWTAFTIPEHTSQYEWVYYEAIQWLENLYITIEDPSNSTNKKKLEDLVYLQMENGTEMMARLSAYQEYEPIAQFSDLLINILDCKYYTFDINQLREEVISVRNQLYILPETATK